MLPAQNVKYVLGSLAFETIKDNASFAIEELDTAGWDYLEIIMAVGATDIAMSALAVTESDSTGSGHANVTGLIWATSANIDGDTSALPTATDDDTFQIAHVDLRYRKRYIDVTATMGDGTAGGYFLCVYRLSRGDVAPITVSGMGADEVLRV